MIFFCRAGAVAAIVALLAAGGCKTPETAVPQRMEVVTVKGKNLWGDQICEKPPTATERHEFEKFAAKNGEIPVLRAIEALAGMAGMRVEFDPAFQTGKQFLYGTNVVSAPPVVNVTVNLRDLAGLGVRQALVAIVNAYDLRIYQLGPSDKWQVTYESSRSPEAWRAMHGGWMQLRPQTRD